MCGRGLVDVRIRGVVVPICCLSLGGSVEARKDQVRDGVLYNISMLLITLLLNSYNSPINSPINSPTRSSIM